MITVFYDGKCGFCRREINHYMRIAPVGVFKWVDITVTPEPFTMLGFSLIDGLKILHVQDEKGEMHTALNAFGIIWQKLPRWWLLSKIIGLPIVQPILNRMYDRFAKWRFKRLYCARSQT